LHFLHRDEEAIAEFKRALALQPNFVFALGDLCTSYADTGRLREARQILHARLMPLYPEEGNTSYCASHIANREHNNSELKEIAQRGEASYARGTLSAGLVAWPYAFMGDFDKTLRWLERAYQDRNFDLFFVITDPDLPMAIQLTPRWKALVQRPALQERARIRDRILARGA
jgi:tetratricopeptide (TPR) repeat protein